MLALAVPMTLLFLGTEVIAHISDSRKARAALAGEPLCSFGAALATTKCCVNCQKAMTVSSLRRDAPHQDW